jgi:hypothetical protein
MRNQLLGAATRAAAQVVFIAAVFKRNFCGCALKFILIHRIVFEKLCIRRARRYCMSGRYVFGGLKTSTMPLRFPREIVNVE